MNDSPLLVGEQYADKEADPSQDDKRQRQGSDADERMA
jgi:hypothetical protein